VCDQWWSRAVWATVDRVRVSVRDSSMARLEEVGGGVGWPDGGRQGHRLDRG
jgi:hypothetical protein